MNSISPQIFNANNRLNYVFKMNELNYWTGVFFAILSGIATNIGTILQKKVVNEIPPDSKLMGSLIRNKLWLLGLLLGFVIGAIFYMIAQSFIGPALIPGLMNSGLIVLAIGSLYILNEDLRRKEIIGIVIMIIAILLLGLSRFSIDISIVNLFEISFLIRLSSFTFILLLVSILFEILQRSLEILRGVFLALFSGNMFALSNLWISILVGTIGKVFSGNFLLNELALFICSAVILVLSNSLGVFHIQKSFRTGQASNLILVQQAPIQICPLLIYFLIYLLQPPNSVSVIYLIISIILIILSAYLLGQRQVKIEKIT